MYRRINLYLDYLGHYDHAWQDYMDLFDRYPNDSYEVAARKSMERIVPNKKAYGQRLAQAGYYNEALTQFFELAKYPVVKTNEINQLIGDAYRGQAEEYLHEGDYLEADRFLRIALQYVPDQRPQIEAKLQEIVGLFIKRGDEYLAVKDFDTAMTYYQKVFEIIPDYPPGLQAIQRLNTTKQNIARAAQLFELGQRSEASGRYAEALAYINRPIPWIAVPKSKSTSQTSKT